MGARAAVLSIWAGETNEIVPSALRGG
jgi:hypothetical protein